MKLNYLFTIAAFLSFAITTAQVNAGQIDDFENGTTQNWTDGGSTNPPVNIPTGGPAGANDNYLSNTSLGGSGEGSKMVMFNEQQWAGNYTNENIVAIKCDVRALTNDLNLRVAFDGGGGRICVINPVTITAAGAWEQVIIPITEADFTLVAGGTNIAQTLADVSTMRILSNPIPSWQGESIVATLEIDNIEASLTILDVDDLSSSGAFEISPNPGIDYLNISLASYNNALDLNIYDVTGAFIYSQKITGINTSIPVSNLNSGVYFIEVANETSNQIKRFIKL